MNKQELEEISKINYPLFDDRTRLQLIEEIFLCRKIIKTSICLLDLKIHLENNKAPFLIRSYDLFEGHLDALLKLAKEEFEVSFGIGEGDGMDYVF